MIPVTAMFFILLGMIFIPAILITASTNAEKCKKGLSKVKSTLMFSFLSDAIIGAILFSILGLSINLFINNDAFCFQWGISNNTIDTSLLKDYKFIRNTFLFIGVGVGILLTTLSQFKVSKFLKQSDD